MRSRMDGFAKSISPEPGDPEPGPNLWRGWRHSVRSGGNYPETMPPILGASNTSYRAGTERGGSARLRLELAGPETQGIKCADLIGNTSAIASRTKSSRLSPLVVAIYLTAERRRPKAVTRAGHLGRPMRDKVQCLHGNSLAACGAWVSEDDFISSDDRMASSRRFVLSKAIFQVQQFGSRMIGELGNLSMISGSALALYARRHRSKVLEACAGALLIVGLICFGASLPE